ncbi:MAG: DUF4282 domain-containing protein [Gammaproteobacteria bacterium]
MKNFLMFRRMLTPILIQVIFWLITIGCIISGIVDIVNHVWINGLVWIFIVPILARIGCELLILFFRMNETLTDIENLLKKNYQN